MITAGPRQVQCHGRTRDSEPAAVRVSDESQAKVSLSPMPAGATASASGGSMPVTDHWAGADHWAGPGQSPTRTFYPVECLTTFIGGDGVVVSHLQ